MSGPISWIEVEGLESQAPPRCVSPVWKRGKREIFLKDEGEITITRRLNSDERNRLYEEFKSKKLTGEASAAAAEKAKNAPCRGLKPYNNLDELLYQFYINFDSDCLFTMPQEELEKIWETKFFNADLAEQDPDYRQRLKDEGYSFSSQPYESEKDAFYILVSNKQNPDKTTSFFIRATKNYLGKNETIFLGGRLPGLLPTAMMGPMLPLAFRHNCQPGEKWDYALLYYVNSYNTRKFDYRGLCKIDGVAINGF